MLAVCARNIRMICAPVYTVTPVLMVRAMGTARMFDAAEARRGSVAVVAGGREHTYGELLRAADHVAGALRARAGGDVRGRSVGLLVRPSFEYVASLWGTWRAGGVSVPLSPSHPAMELQYYVDDAGCNVVLTEEALRDRLPAAVSALDAHALLDKPRGEPPQPPSPAMPLSNPALFIYTSGTTGRPKGVVHTHGSLQAQVDGMVQAWEWTPRDRILATLPLNHVHGIVNVLLCAMATGAVWEVQRRFDPAAVWARMTDAAAPPLSLFMGVPTMYARLLDTYASAPEGEQRAMSAAARQLRLFVSGSAPLPSTIFNEWERITSHRLLERYGMSEIGMALSNPLHGERREGAVGLPLPGVDVRLRGEDGCVHESEGELQVRGASLFHEYHGMPEVTAREFDGPWFCTGDVVARDGTPPYYRILGRMSADIIKSGGYKLSALEIERELQEHPDIREVAVLGMPDDAWGQRVACVVATRSGDALPVDTLRAWARERMAAYKLPQEMHVVAEIPRNAMGKVDKRSLRDKLLAGDAL